MAIDSSSEIDSGVDCWHTMLGNIPEPFRRAAIRDELRLARLALTNLKKFVAKLETMLEESSSH